MRQIYDRFRKARRTYLQVIDFRGTEKSKGTSVWV